MYLQNSELAMSRRQNLKFSIHNFWGGLRYKTGGFVWRSARRFLNIVYIFCYLFFTWQINDDNDDDNEDNGD